MRLVIIESPFSGDEARNRIYLQRCIRDCLDRGESPYASHQMLTDALRDSVPKERAHGIAAGFEWRKVAEATVVYEDYGESAGMRAGIVDAYRLIRMINEMPRHVRGDCAHVVERRRIGPNPEAPR